MIAEDILLKDLGGVAVQFEYAGIECQHILGCDLPRRRGGGSRNRRHIGGQTLGIRYPATGKYGHEDHQAEALHVSLPLLVPLAFLAPAQGLADATTRLSTTTPAGAR